VSRICKAIKEEFEAFRHRELSGIEPEYLYLAGCRCLVGCAGG
jgi:transposase-like protein